MTELAAGISPAAGALIAEMTAAGFEIPTRDTLLHYRAGQRAEFESAVQHALAQFNGVIESIEIDDIPCLQLTPSGWLQAAGRVIQYAFGGGYVSGSAYGDQILTAPLAQRANARVVMVEYRLSPEYPFPAPQLDMRRVYPALLNRYGAERLVISGESAGGNQALGLLQFARDQGLAMPRCAVLFSPWCDLSNRGDSHVFNDSRDPTLNNAWVDQAAAWHAKGQRLDDPGISPLYGEMQGLPPVIVTSGSRDLLLSQCLCLAQRLRQAGVKCDLRVWEGLWHVFEFYPIPEAEYSIAEVAHFIEAHC